MSQRGRIHGNNSSWFLTYREPVVIDGVVTSKQRVVKLASRSAEYPSVASVRPLAEKILAPINTETTRPESAQTVVSFLEHYLAVCKTKLRPSTVHGYCDMFKLVKPHLGTVTVHRFRTPEADKLLKDATADKQRAHTTHRNLKTFLSSAFKYAKRIGIVNDNPVRDIEIPRGKPKGERPAYTLDEVAAMLKVLPEPSRTVVYTAALTGLRLSELKGLRWEDFEGDSVLIQRSVWSGQVSETKTLASKAYIPIVSPLMTVLAKHRERNSGTGYVFHSSNGSPIRLENLLRREMREPLEKAGIDWRGWHPFRYGVGTTLRELGVDIKLIQQILRHSDQKLTMQFYIKPTTVETGKAMAKLEKALQRKLA